MTVVVTGARGLLGQDMVRVLRAEGHRVVALTRAELDIARRGSVRDALRAHRPQAVVNCAGYTAVDRAESDPEAAHAANADGPRNLAEQCAETGGRLFHLSSDYVFPGTSDRAYPEHAAPRPLNVYGHSKLAGERAVTELLPERGCVLRCSWLYGAAGPNFVATMRRLAHGDGPVDVVADQHGQPSWSVDVAEAVALLLPRRSVFGTLHVSNAGETTWYALAREVFTLCGQDPDRVRPVGTEQFPRPAARPPRSTLAHHRWSAAGLPPRRHWRDALHAAWPTLNRSGG